MTAGGVLAAGTSVGSMANTFAKANYSVKYKLEIGNFTKFPLVVHENRIMAGHTFSPPESVYPGRSEAMAGENDLAKSNNPYV